MHEEETRKNYNGKKHMKKKQDKVIVAGNA